MIIAERCHPSYEVESGAVDVAAMYNNLDGNLAAVVASDVFDSTECTSQYWYNGPYDETSKRILAVQWRVRAQGHGTLAIADRASYGADIGYPATWSPAGKITVDSDEPVDYHIPASAALASPSVWDYYGVDGQITCTAGTVQIDTAAAFIIFSTNGETSWTGDIPGGWAQHGSVTREAGIISTAFTDGISKASAETSEPPTLNDLNNAMAAAATGATWQPNYGFTQIEGHASAGYTWLGRDWSVGADVSYRDAYLTVDAPAAFAAGPASYTDDLVWGQDWIYDPDYFVDEDLGAGVLLDGVSIDGPPTVDVTAAYGSWDHNVGESVSDESWTLGYERVSSLTASYRGDRMGNVVLSGTKADGQPPPATFTLPTDLQATYAIYPRTAMMRAAGTITATAGGTNSGGNNSLTVTLTPRPVLVNSGPFRYWHPQASRPPLRQRQRSDGLAASGAPRQHQRATIQSSIRQRAIR